MSRKVDEAATGLAAEEEEDEAAVRLAVEKKEADNIRLAAEKIEADNAQLAAEKQEADNVRLAAEKAEADNAQLAVEKQESDEIAARLAAEKEKADEVAAQLAVEKQADEQAIQYHLNGASAPSPSNTYSGWPAEDENEGEDEDKDEGEDEDEDEDEDMGEGEDEDEDEDNDDENESEDIFQYPSPTENHRGLYGARSFLGQVQGLDHQNGRLVGISDDANDPNGHECSRAALGQPGPNETENLAIELFKGMASAEAKSNTKSSKEKTPDEAQERVSRVIKQANGTYKCSKCDHPGKHKSSVYKHYNNHHVV